MELWRFSLQVMASLIALALAMPAAVAQQPHPDPLPVGPHVLISVPINLVNVPPQVDTYEVRCVAVLTTSGGAETAGTDARFYLDGVTGVGPAPASVPSRSRATGSATGPVVPASTTASDHGINFSTTAVVALRFSLGQAVGPSAGVTTAQSIMQTPGAYECRLFLRGTTGGLTTTYLDEQGLTYQDPNANPYSKTPAPYVSAFPLAPAGPFRRDTRDPNATGAGRSGNAALP